MPTVAAIIVAAGPGSRLGAGMPKAFVAVAGAPLVVHSLRAILAAPSVASVVLVVPRDQLHRAEAALQAYGPWRCSVRVIAGGAERQDSVRHGLAAVTGFEIIAIHDGARPFIDRASIEEAVQVAARQGAAVVAAPATDTVKQVGSDRRIEQTLPRDRVWLAQTPQVFHAELIRRAHAAAAAGSATATDDAMLVEQLGAPVYVVAGNPENRKITTPADLRWAESVLARRAPH